MIDIDNTEIYTDIKSLKWIESGLPQFMRPYAYLARLDRPIGIWLLLLPAWWSIMLASGGLKSLNQHDMWVMVLFAAGAVIMRAAGCVINDLWDKDLDKAVQRTRLRPLASGLISPLRAVIFLVCLLLLALLILMQMSLVTVLLGFLSIPFIILYPLMKRITWWPQLFLGLTFNFGALMGWSAVTGILEPVAFLIYFAGVFWTLGYDTIYAHQDKEDDARIGIKSTALKLGSASKIWVFIFYLLSWLFMVSAFFTLKTPSYLAFLLLAAVAGHFIWQVKTWNRQDPFSALKKFKSNRNLGILVFIAASV